MQYIFQIIFVWGADGALRIGHVTLHLKIILCQLNKPVIFMAMQSYAT